MARQIRTTAEATELVEPKLEAKAPEQVGASVTFVNNITNRWLILNDGTKYRFPDTKVTTSDQHLIDSLTNLANTPGTGIFIHTAE